MVRQAQEYIRAGDIFQVVPSQRLSRHVNASPFTVYRALRAINPSPYMFFLDLEDFHIIGASPELLVRYEDQEVTIRPIAGTRPRGHDTQSDEQRGVYAGAVGYFSHSGNQETAIALRTMVIKDGRAYIQAGGGVVADSIPENEYQESLNKAKAQLRALDEAENIARDIVSIRQQ